jgi:uncharacterized membrane protein YeaQ/YmgE (transglycosylase-associated protein family)
MGIVSWAVFGLVAGALAKFLMPGKAPGGIFLTIVLGVVGAIVGGYIGTLLGFGDISGFQYQEHVVGRRRRHPRVVHLRACDQGPRLAIQSENRLPAVRFWQCRWSDCSSAAGSLVLASIFLDAGEHHRLPPIRLEGANVI